MALGWKHAEADPSLLEKGMRGIYFLIDDGPEAPAYIGKSEDLRSRLMEHMRNRTELTDGCWSIRFVVFGAADDLDKIEQECIFHYKPPFNRTHKQKTRKRRALNRLSAASIARVAQAQGACFKAMMEYLESL